MFAAVLAAAPEGHLANRARFGQLQLAVGSGDSDTIDERQQRLGLLHDFLVLGAFHEKRETAWVIMPPESFPEWLDPANDARTACALLQTYPAEPMAFYRVSQAVNNVRNDDPSCTAPLNAA